MASTLIERLQAHRDARGALFEPLTDAGLNAQKNVHVVLTEPGGIRGNHVHEAATETTSVVGPCRVRLKDADSVRDVDVPAGEVWRFTIPPGVVHAFHNTGPGILVLVSFSTHLHDATGTHTRSESVLT